MRKLLYTLLLICITTNLFAQTQTFQDTQGKLEVSSSGQATYTVPIAMPPSIQDVGPKINLTYASGQSGGIAGQGWNISGISMISRIASRKDIDGFVDGVDFDADDKLALDGQRLILKTGTGAYWAAGSQYETETQSNLKIELIGSYATMEFIVTQPDGSRSWYSAKTNCDACPTLATNAFFYIYKYLDANGNQIEYSYIPGIIQTTNPYITTARIKEIKFSLNANSNTTYLNSILFTYKYKQRGEYSYFVGNKYGSYFELDFIQVFTNNGTTTNLLFRKYQLNYNVDELFYERLGNIVESNGAGELANPIVFEYPIAQQSINYNVNYCHAGGSNQPIVDFRDVILAGDFNDDSRQDYISTNYFSTLRYYNQSAGLNQSSITTALPFTADKRKTLTVNNAYGNKFLQKPSLLNITENLNGTSDFKFYSMANMSSNFILNHTKVIAFDNNLSYVPGLNQTIEAVYTSVGSTVACQAPIEKISNKYLEGDFNGDGVSEILVYRAIYEQFFYKTTNYRYFNINNSIHHSVCETIYIDSGKECYLLDTNPNSSTVLGQNGYLLLANSSLLQGDKKYVADFNGDGKADVLVIYRHPQYPNTIQYRLVGFKQTVAAPFVSLEIIGQGIFDNAATATEYFLGDYNGDGKTDIMYPKIADGCETCSDWVIQYCNGISNPNLTSFTKNDKVITPYVKRLNYSDDYYVNQYIVMDTNKDGKSDLVTLGSHVYQASCFPCSGSGYIWKTRQNIKSFTLNTSGTYYNDTSTGWFTTASDGGQNILDPISNNEKIGGLRQDLVLAYFTYNSYLDVTTPYEAVFVNFSKNFTSDNLMTKVTSSGGAIIDEIEYSQLSPTTVNVSGTGTSTDIYSSLNASVFPALEIKNLPSQKIVSRLKNTAVGVVRFQDFKYQGLTVVNDGIGFLGFNKTARTSWYSPNVSSKKVWSVIENSPTLRGAPTRSYTRVLDSNTSFDFSASLSTGLMNKTENTYYPAVLDATTKKYTLLLDTQTTTDYLTNVTTTKKYQTYSTDGFNLPKVIISKNYLGSILQSTSTTSTNYANNVGIGVTSFNYYIGRPTDVNTTIEAYSDTKSTFEKLSYTNGNITKKEKSVGTTAASAIASLEKIVETMTYHTSGNGNLMSKSISAVGFPVTLPLKPALAARTTSYTYDTTNRFVKTTTDVDGIVTTNDTYDPLYGVVLSQTNNTLAQTTTSIYDNWGKRIRVTNFVGITYYSYVKDSNTYYTFQTGSDESHSYVQSDALGRVIRNASLNINEYKAFVDYQYDALGRKIKESLPYFETDTPIWTTFYYDEYDRSSGFWSTSKFVNTTYNGLTSTTNDGILTKTATIDANSNVITTSENATVEGITGGTITNSYNALGNLITSNYDGVITEMTYDLWGRKTQLKDPSAGIFIYDYNAFGEIVQETNPNGKTDYLYTATGKISFKRVYDLASPPANTNITTDYAYDGTYKWLNSMVVTNPFDGNSTYAYSYDIGTSNGNTNTKQLKKTIETISPTGSGDIVFTKELTFYPSGRVFNEKSTATAHGQTSTKNITNTYRFGHHYQIFDGLTETGVPLWQANIVNARGQLKTATLGNGLALSKTYDVIGNPLSTSYTKPQTNIQFNAVFDAAVTYSGGDPMFGVGGVYKSGSSNLTSRINTIANNGNVMEANEDFTYDGFDRLSKIQSGGLSVFSTDFSANDAGFVPFNQSFFLDAGTATQILENGKLKVSTTGNAGTKKLIFQNAIQGKSFKVNADLVKTADSSGWSSGTLHLKVLEVNSTTQEIMYYSIVNLNSIYTLTQNCDLYIAFCSAVSLLYPGEVIFTVDNVLVTEQIQSSQTYDTRGKILTNELGSYKYSATKPYQNTAVALTPAGNAYYDTRGTQVITYNAFQSPIKILEGGKDAINFGYNGMQQRMVMYYGSTNPDKLLRPYRKYYSADGSMEIKYSLPVTVAPTAPAKVEFYTYVGGDGYTAPVVTRKIDGATPENYYLHRDYLGSVLAITNSAGAVIEKRQFDAWGNIIKVQNGAGITLNKLTFFDRGFTGHEHLESVVLINMNARLYDPKTHRLLGPDNLVTNPSSTQDYNRYAYARNNPLKYVDPSGNEPITTAIVIGVAIGLASYFVSAAINHTPITFNGILTTVVISAISSIATFGVGSAVGTIGNFAVKTAVQSLAHGFVQGGMANIQGGKFWSGFASGSLSSLAASGFGAIPRYGQSAVGTLAFGAIAGGAGAALSGGNFWEGAVTGLVVSGLNHLMHDQNRGNRKLTNKFNKAISSLKGNPIPGQGSIDTVMGLDPFKTVSGNSGNPTVNYIENTSGASELESSLGDDAYYTTSYNDGGDNDIHNYTGSKGGYINVFRNSFSSWKDLGSNIMHELGHAYSRHSGMFGINYGKMGGNWNDAIALDELYAYTFARQFGVSFYYQNTSIFISGLQSSLNRLNIK